MQFNKIVALLLVVLSLAGGCSKDDDGDNNNNNNNNNNNCFTLPDAPELTSNSPVPAGQQLVLGADAVANAEYRWAGPNGQEYIEQDQIITFSGPTDAGEYQCYVIVDGCTSTVATINVVGLPPTVPCTPANNTMDADSLSDVIFSQVTANPDADSLFKISADGDNGNLSITFAFPKAPNAGIYNIVPATTPVDSLQPDDVRISFATIGIVPCTYSPPSGDLYVTHENSKVAVTFCGVAFDSDACPDITATAKVVVQ